MLFSLFMALNFSVQIPSCWLEIIAPALSSILPSAPEEPPHGASVVIIGRRLRRLRRTPAALPLLALWAAHPVYREGGEERSGGLSRRHHVESPGAPPGGEAPAPLPAQDGAEVVAADQAEEVKVVELVVGAGGVVVIVVGVGVVGVVVAAVAALLVALLLLLLLLLVAGRGGGGGRGGIPPVVDGLH